jgi:Ion channel
MRFYFTVATLTTTGFGDITLVGTEGRLLAIVMMSVGISLFLRMVQVLFRPPPAAPEVRLLRPVGSRERRRALQALRRAAPTRPRPGIISPARAR